MLLYTTDTYDKLDSDRDLKKLRNRVKLLQKKPQPEQRSEEWFKQRQTRVTASEAASCLYKSEDVCNIYAQEFGISNFKYKPNEPLNPYETKEDYIIKKCSAFYGEQVFKDTVFTLWGKKYEDVASRLYKKLYNTQVYDFGLLSHSRYKWLAASPDGITEDGIMLEIKCPKSRKIDNSVPPLYYYVQMQIQLEVCNLEECDFLECEIVELETQDEFINTEIVGKQDKGIVLQIITNESGDPKFIYPPQELNTSNDFINWMNNTILESPQYILKPTYYFIKKYNIIRVKRNKTWFGNIKEDIKKTWDIIMRLQSNKEDFEKYKHSIHLIKNKEYISKWNSTMCLIGEEESEFILDTVNSPIDIPILQLTEDMEIDQCEEKNNIIKPKSINNTLCLIESTE